MNFKSVSFRDTVKKVAAIIAAAGVLFAFQNCGKAMESAGSDGDEISSVNTPPPSPTNLNANVVSSTEVSLSWADPSTTADAAADFTIERATVNGATVGMYKVVVSLPAGTTTFTDTTATAGTTYNYFVISANVDGASMPTSVVTITTTP